MNTLMQGFDETAEALELAQNRLEALRNRVVADDPVEPSTAAPEPVKARFQECLARVLRHEGGFVDHPSDPGGATNRGITIGTARHYYGPNFSVDHLKAITNEQIEHIYHAGYWNLHENQRTGELFHCGMLPMGVDYMVFDCSVNSGPARSVMFLQESLGVAVDGVFGPKTLSAAKSDPASVVMSELYNRRMAFLRSLSTWPVFGDGWTNRVEGVYKMAKEDLVNGRQ